MQQMQYPNDPIEASPRGSGWSQITQRHFIAVSMLAIAIGIIATIEGTAGVSGKADTDQLAFFFPAAQKVLDGHPFDIYSVRFGTYPNYNPPLSTLLMAPLIGLAQAIHLPGVSACVASGYNDKSCRSLLGFVGIWFIPFVILAGVAVLSALRRIYPSLSNAQALIAYSLVVLSPLTWLNFTTWWHFEQPMMLFFFIAGIAQLQGKRPYLAGLLLGLALLTRTTAAVPLISLLVVLATEQAWVTIGKLIAPLAAVVALGFGPFFLFNPTDTSFSLLQWRGTAAIGNSIWSWFTVIPSLGRLAARLDLPTAVLVAAVIAYVAVKRFGVSSENRDLYAVLATASLMVPMLSKTNWPYYYAEPFLFLVIWEFVTVHDAPVGMWRWPVLSLFYLSAAATLAQFMGLPSATGGGIVLRLMGTIQFLSILAFVYAIWQRLTDLHPSSAPAIGQRVSSPPVQRRGQ